MEEIKLEKGINEEKVEQISKLKNEPDWMRDLRIKSYREFESKPLPSFGPEIKLNFNDITYYRKVDNKVHNKWDTVNKNIKNTFDDIGLIEQ